jgi:hypothetical protein
MPRVPLRSRAAGPPSLKRGAIDFLVYLIYIGQKLEALITIRFAFAAG